MGDESIIDRAVFGELLASVGGDAEFMGELIDTYLCDSDGLLAQLRGALATGDLERFRRAAHSLKSSSASFGASGLAAQARALEMMARAGSLDGAEAEVSGAEESYTRVRAELERLRMAG